MSLYRENIIKVDLGKPLARSAGVELLAEGDVLADRFGAELYRNGTAADLTGCTATAYFIRSDGNTVMFSGSVDGNTVYADLPQVCYIKPGSFSLALRVNSGSLKETVRVVDGYIRLTTTDGLIDPYEVIPSLDELLAQIAVMETAIDNADTATAAANTAASGADTSAANADAKAALANTAAENANSKATLADQKAALADQKATLANTAAANADAKAALADTAAANANSKAELADHAAAYANGLRAPIMWNGTAITGTSTAPTAYATGIESAVIGDYYLYTGTDNANVGNVYRCTLGGDAATALWVYEANWRGAPGSGAVSYVDGLQPNADGDVVLGAVRTTAQTLTDTQKAQARANLDAAKNAAVTASDDGLMSATDKGKLDGIPADTQSQINGVKPLHTTVSLPTEGWSQSSGLYLRTVSVDGVTADNDVVVTPDVAYMDVYGKAQIKCTEQGAGTLGFAAKAVPSVPMTINLLIIPGVSA